jgi:DNA-binding transcriptional LysR family regulator
VEVAANERLIDLAAEGFDAGVRLGQLVAADMIAVPLTPPIALIVVGSPDYFERHGRPDHIKNLREHACLRLRRTNGSIAPWPFVDGNKSVEAIVSGPLIAHDYSTLLGAAVQGLGLLQAPAPITADAVKTGRLERVLEGFAPTVPGMYLYYPGHRQIVPKLRAFIDHLKSRTRTT